MRFFRTRHEGRGLALLALAALLVSSFGHFHRDVLTAGATALECRVFFKPSHDESCPPVHPAHSECAICFTVALAGSGVIPQAPTFAPPAPVEPSPLIGREAPSLHDIATASFDARGPPSSLPA